MHNPTSKNTMKHNAPVEVAATLAMIFAIANSTA